MMWCTLVAMVFHVPLNYWLVMVKHWGVLGVAIASVVTNLIMVVLLVGYVWMSGMLRKRVSGDGDGGSTTVVAQLSSMLELFGDMFGVVVV
ncbi:hypothetical protein AXX17_AT2G11990 [Arabidopsis thaliana]|uniref:Uncharacterized protein n=2 Tax=Arabidopsis TaxID=3701 RepID=A0A178VPZ0_ARATH|nr:hypothetical protein AXX17_AT2G11990 [Arabidopsis thaliana]